MASIPRNCCQTSCISNPLPRAAACTGGRSSPTGMSASCKFCTSMRRRRCPAGGAARTAAQRFAGDDAATAYPWLCLHSGHRRRGRDHDRQPPAHAAGRGTGCAAAVRPSAHDRVRRGHALADTLALVRGEMETVSAWRGASLSALLTLLLIGIARLANATAPAAVRSNSRPARHFQHFQQMLESAYREQKEIAHYAGASASRPRSSTACAARRAGSRPCR